MFFSLTENKIMKILAIDQSLTNSGWCIMDSLGEYTVGNIIPKKLRGVRRLCYIEDRFRELVDATNPDLVVMEGYAMGIRGGRVFDLGELGAVIKLTSIKSLVKVCIVPPMTLKKFVTGKGNSKKQEMLMHIYKRWAIEFSDDNKADAFCLALVGHTLLDSDYVKGLYSVTATQCDSLSKVSYEDYLPDTTSVAVRSRRRSRKK